MSDALVAAMRAGWTQLAAMPTGARTWRAIRISVPGPLILFAALRNRDGVRCLLFETPIINAPAARSHFEADGLSVEEDRDFRDATYRMAVVLERVDLENIYGIVTGDLVSAAATASSATQAIQSLLARLLAWQAFLRARRMGLAKEAVVGLFGELVTFEQVADVIGWDAASDAWKGPLGQLHDFSRNGTALEVKTTAGAGSSLESSSLDQFDDAGLSSLFLVHVHLAEAPGRETLPGLIDSIRSRIEAEAGHRLSAFNDLLLAAGYADVDRERYVSWLFVVASIRAYRVRQGFPRVTRLDVPQGVIEARYRIEIRALQPFALTDAERNDVVRGMGEGA